MKQAKAWNTDNDIVHSDDLEPWSRLNVELSTRPGSKTAKMAPRGFEVCD